MFIVKTKELAASGRQKSETGLPRQANFNGAITQIEKTRGAGIETRLKKLKNLGSRL